MIAHTTDRPDFETPEQAAAAIRNGRLGYALAVRNAAGRWQAYAAHLPLTKDGAITSARAAIVLAGDASRVAVVGADGKRLHVPTPRAAKGAPSK